MKFLVVLSGIPGSGKSTWIKENNLDEFTLSTDKIRTLLSSYVIDENGNRIINQKVSKRTFSLLNELIETRMSFGQLVIIDATHTRQSYFNNYSKLADKYGYRKIVVDFDIDPKIAIERDSKRKEGFVGPECIIQKYEAKQKLVIPNGWIKTTPEKFWEAIEWRTEDFGSKTVNVFGDIHGCYKPLKEFFEVHPYQEDEIYVFTGDYLDRGLENREVFEFMLNFSKKPNVILLTGNHERHIFNFTEGLNVPKEFLKTYEQIKEYEPKFKSFYRNLRQCLLFERNGQKYFVNHGGLPFMPEHLAIISVSELTGQVGGYETDIDKIWNDNYSGVIQIHGHRSLRDDDGSETSINLEGKVEFGHYLKVWRNGVVERYQNTPNQESFENSPIVSTKDLGNGIKSFNFTRDAFFKSEWTTISVKARGLFMRENQVVARSYDKFFNIDELEETKKENLAQRKGGVDLFLKENGYLGIVSVIDEELHFFSKSTDKSDFARWFKNLFNKSCDVDFFKTYLRENNSSAVFEVIDIQNDPHIIKYDESKLALLEVIKNDLNYSSVPYSELIKVAERGKVQVKKYIKHLDSWKELTDLNLDDLVGKQEGVVAVGEDDFMCKYKTSYYNYWKQMRKISEKIAKGKEIGSEEPFTNWLLDHKELSTKPIIELRELFLK